MRTRRSFLKGVGLLAASAAFPAPALAGTSYWGQRPKPESDFIFGYGSLINTPSRESTGRPGMTAVPARLSPDFGYVRSWCARATRSGWTALGLRRLGPEEAGWSLNGVLFAVEPDLLPRFDRRESGYDRVNVPRAQIEALSWEGLPEEGNVWVYVPKSQSEPAAVTLYPDLAHPILQSYLDLCLHGALEQGREFAREFISTTADWGTFWLNDRVTARRAFASTPQAGVIDEMLSSVPPADAAYPHRLYSEAYAVRMMRAAP